jgi:hypothetical protein
MGNCSSTSNCNPCGPDFNAINLLANKTASYARQANTSAVDAANSATDAENYWKEFNALYLGSFASAPTTDNEGNPLQEGALYFNSVSDQMFVWNGTSWIDFDFDEFTPFLATGTTTARNLVTRFDDVVNVLDYGLVDTPSNTTATIQNAINLNPGKTIFFPDRIYTTNATIYVRSNSTKLRGDGVNTGIYANHSGDGIVFEPTTAGVTSAFLSGTGIESLFVTRAIAGNGGNAIWVRQCSGFVANGVRANNHDYGFRISGGQLNAIYNSAAVASSPYTAPAGDCAGILLERADYGVGLSQPCYTVRIDNFIGGPFPTQLWKYVILVRDIDGLQISNCYINFANTALLKFQRQSGGTVTAITISNVYFDTMLNPANAIRIQNESGVTGYGVSALSITNSFIGNNNTQNLYLIDFRSYGERVNFSNNVIANSGDFALHINDGSEANEVGSYTFTGNTFSNTSSDNPSGGAAYINNAANVCFSGNNFLNTVTAGYQVLLTGKTDNASFVGNTTDSSTGNLLLNTSGLTINEQLISIDASNDRAQIQKSGDAELRITSTDNQKPQITLNRPLGASYQLINNSGLFELNFASPGIDSAKTTSIKVNPGISLQLYEPAVEFRNITTTVNAANAFIDSSANNRIYRSSSSIQFKKDIESIDPSYSEKVLKLKPVWYRSKCEADNSEWSYWGLIAEEVEKVDPRLVTYGYDDEDYETVEITKENGDVISERVPKKDAVKKPMGVQYDRVPVLMLDILKKQQKQIEELSAKVEALESK